MVGYLIVNHTCRFINGGSFEIMPTVPLMLRSDGKRGGDRTPC